MQLLWFRLNLVRLIRPPLGAMDNAIHSKGTMISSESGKSGMKSYETYNIVVQATYVTPKNKGTYIIEFKVGNGALTVFDKVVVKVGDDRSTGSEADEPMK